MSTQKILAFFINFNLGPNDIEDIRDGGPSHLGFSLWSKLPKEEIEEVCNSSEIVGLAKIKSGPHNYGLSITQKELDESNTYDTKELLKERILYWLNYGSYNA